jgi:tyrosine-protein phosphatase YwqE
MTATLEERVTALETQVRGEHGLTDQRRALKTMLELLDGTRERMSAAEIRLERIEQGILKLIAENAYAHGRLEAKIDAVDAKVDAVRNELKTDISNLRRDMPGIVAEAMREVLRSGNKS